MKNQGILFVIMLISFALTTAKAQYISIGPSVGFQHTWLTMDLPAGVTNTFNPGFNAGGSFVYSTQSHLGLGADLKYSLEGNKQKIDSLSQTFDWNVSYLRLPIRVIYFFGEYGNSVRPKVFLGPTLGLVMNSKFDGVDVKDQTNSFDFGVHGGVGVNIKLAEAVWLNTDITYTQGLMDVTDNVFTDESNLNGMVALNLGVLFGFGFNKDE